MVEIKHILGYSTGLFLGITLGSMLGIPIIYGPTWLFLKKYDRLWTDEFAAHYPKKRWVALVYPILGLAIVFATFHLTVQIRAWPPLTWTSIFFYQVFCSSAIGIGILGGLFEVFMGVSPIPRGRKGCVRSPWMNQFIYAQEANYAIRKVGLVRVWLGVLFIPASILISWLAYHYHWLPVDAWYQVPRCHISY